QRVGADVDDARAIDVDELHDVRPALAGGRDFDEREVARDLRRRGDVARAPDRYEFVQVRLEPARAVLVGLDDYGHARHAVRFGVSHGQRLDGEVATAEQRRDAVQHARLVVDVDG